ncbi:MAG: hypothetical protein DI552_00140 [Brevundimonas sp.]|nr:MAG: hypothetical protein DI552_00140 [Brevundimonas sp.]
MAQAALSSAEAQRTQQRYDALLGVQNAPIPSARESASVFMLDDEQARRAQQLRDALDPAAAAQSRLNNELKEYQVLANAGKISTGELAQLQAQARTRFDETTAAIQRSERGLTRLAVASRLNLARQGADVFTTAAMGMSPAMIAIQQGSQILDALATSGIKASGALIAVGAGLGAAAAGVVLMAAAWAKGQDAAATYVDATTGVGRTAGLTASQLRDLTVAAAENGEISRSAARQLAADYLATGQIGGEVLGGLITLTKDYASFMGVDAEQASKNLAKAMLDPKAAAHDMTLQFGLLNQEQLRNIDNMIEQGDLLGAQKVLLDQLTSAVSGHADKAEEITDVWNAIGRSISDAIDKLGEFLLTTEDERIPKLQRQLALVAEAERRGNPNDNRREFLERQIRVEQTRRSMVALIEDGRTADAAANQRAERDRQAAERREREGQGAASRARAAAARAQREAERERREALQRQRRDEDRASQVAIEVAKSFEDVDQVRVLEDEVALRQRIRQLVDDGVTAEAARTKAMEEQATLVAARERTTYREREALIVAASFEEDRILGNHAIIKTEERRLELLDRIESYTRAGVGYYQAWRIAADDLRDVEAARAEVAERAALSRERERQIELAGASGDRSRLRVLMRDDWIERRARDIERDRDLNYGQGEGQAEREYGELLRAQTTGALRDGLKGFVDDIRSGGIRDALSEQFDTAATRLLDKLIDGLLDIDFSGGSGKGVGSWLTKGFNFLFGKNAEGTDYWTGGPTWVGERGPELLDLPRGSRVVEHARSLQMMRDAAQPSRAASAAPMTYAPTYHINGVDTARIEAILAKDRREFSAKAVAANRDADSRRLGLG